MVDRMAGAGSWEIISLITKKTKRGRKTEKAAKESGVNWTRNEALNSRRPPQWCKWCTYPIGTAPVHNLPKQFHHLGTECLMSEAVGDIFFFKPPYPPCVQHPVLRHRADGQPQFTQSSWAGKSLPRHCKQRLWCSSFKGKVKGLELIMNGKKNRPKLLRFTVRMNHLFFFSMKLCGKRKKFLIATRSDP